jgi:polar amino acid transport system substrate-binding protein
MDAMTQPLPPITPALVAAFAPHGTLRASINLGNPILANKNATSGEPVGVSIDLAREFARRLGVGIELVVFEKAAASVEAVKNEKADIGFFAVDPARSEGLRFTAPYVLIEGSYLVPESSALTDNAQVDAQGSSHLGRFGQRLRPVPDARDQAGRDRPTPRRRPALAAVRSGDVEVAAGIRQLLEGEAKRAPGVRVLPGRFMVIQQAMGTPSSRGHGSAGLACRVRRRDEGQRVRRRRVETSSHRRGDRRAG